jgi:hypothetical protein
LPSVSNVPIATEESEVSDKELFFRNG